MGTPRQRKKKQQQQSSLSSSHVVDSTTASTTITTSSSSTSNNKTDHRSSTATATIVTTTIKTTTSTTTTTTICRRIMHFIIFVIVGGIILLLILVIGISSSTSFNNHVPTFANHLLLSRTQNSNQIINNNNNNNINVTKVAISNETGSSNDENVNNDKNTISENNTDHDRNDRTKKQRQRQQQRRRPVVTKWGTYKLIEQVPHDKKAFTQGLIVLSIPNNDTSSQQQKGRKLSYFIEGTGMHGDSDIRIVNISTGRVIQRQKLPSTYFGEGIAHYNYYPNGTPSKTTTTTNSNSTIIPMQQQQQQQQRLIQITWQEQYAFIYDIILDSTILNGIKFIGPIGNFTYTTTTGEGWGITYRPDRHIFYVTDGSSNIHIWDATTFVEIGIQSVQMYRDDSVTEPILVQYLNEIEYDPTTQTILANVWYQDIIVRIDPDTGDILTIYNVQSLYTNRLPRTDCFNGIALTDDSSTPNEVWVTGKWWPYMYRIQLID